MAADEKSIGILLRERRKQCGLTLQQLADKAGVALSTVHAIENGTARARVDVFFRVLDALEIDLPQVIPSRGEIRAMPPTAFEAELERRVQQDLLGMLATIVRLAGQHSPKIQRPRRRLKKG